MRNRNSAFSTIGATGHSLEERQPEDYYATPPLATEWLCKLEDFADRILEPACGEGHISEILKSHGYDVVSRDLVDRGYGEIADFLSATHEWQQFDSRARQLIGKPIYIDDTPSLSVFELRTKARRLVREHGVKALMIDYLQLMNASGMKHNSRQEEVSTISRSLKGLAKELNIPILALSQLNRGVENRGTGDKRPQLSDLRESGAIEQDADMVLFIHRPEYYKIYQDEAGHDLRGKAEIIIAKHRNGAVGNVLLTFRGEYARFENENQY